MTSHSTFPTILKERQLRPNKYFGKLMIYCLPAFTTTAVIVEQTAPTSVAPAHRNCWKNRSPRRNHSGMKDSAGKQIRQSQSTIWESKFREQRRSQRDGQCLRWSWQQRLWNNDGRNALRLPAAARRGCIDQLYAKFTQTTFSSSPTYYPLNYNAYRNDVFFAATWERPHFSLSLTSVWPLHGRAWLKPTGLLWKCSQDRFGASSL